MHLSPQVARRSISARSALAGASRRFLEAEIRRYFELHDCGLFGVRLYRRVRNARYLASMAAATYGVDIISAALLDLDAP